MSYLPHIYPVGATFFVTFRLADSLPQHIVKELRIEYNEEGTKIKNEVNDTRKQKELIHNLRHKLFGRYDHQLDNNPYGECHLKDSLIAKILRDKVFQYQGIYYNVDALSIMPNHVHMLLDTSIQVSAKSDIAEAPEHYVDVSKWMQFIKGGSSFLINKLLKRSGTLWEKESYDHYVRFNNPGEYERIKEYIEQNPVKAGLEDRFSRIPYLFSCG